MKRIKVSHLSYSDQGGGAPEAAVSIYLSLKKFTKIKNLFFVSKKKTFFSYSIRNQLFLLFREKVANFIKLFFYSKKMSSSSSLLNSGWANLFNKSNSDIIHMYWINRETISIEEIGKIKKPIVWTLCDMWAFCGGENISDNKRFIEGYKKTNKPKDEKGFDFNRWMWIRKKKNWNKNINLVAPSKWIYDCIKKSSLMNNFNVKIIPFPIDTGFWKSKKKTLVRRNLSLPINKKLILIILSYAEYNWKGGDLFLKSLKILRNNLNNSGFEIILVGSPSDKFRKDLNELDYKIYDLGYVNNKLKMVDIYNAADLLVVPSRNDCLPLVSIEGISCGLPIVSFDVCGLRDTNMHMVNGWSAKAFNVYDLAKGINFILKNNSLRKKMSINSRKLAKKIFDNKKVALQYLNFYKEILSLKKFNSFNYN